MPPANTFFLLSQQIDELLAGALTQEDEDAVLAELEAITQVGVELHVWLLLVQRTVAERARSSPVTPYFTFILQLSESSRDFTLKKLHVCLSRRGIILNKLEASWRRERYHHSYLITGCIIETVMLIKADFFFSLLLLWSNYYSAWRTRDHTNYYVSRLNADADSNL